MKRSWQTFLLMHISLQVSELPDRLLSIIRAPNGERFISKVKYRPSAKKMVKPKQVITFVMNRGQAPFTGWCYHDEQGTGSVHGLVLP